MAPSLAAQGVHAAAAGRSAGWPGPSPQHVAGMVLPFVIYIVLGALLAFGHHVIIGDAWSRVANGYYVFFSRDPHLAAIGFVWTPLPSLLAMPLLPLKGVLPGLVTEGFAANVVSAAAMAGAVWQMRQTLGHLDVRPIAAWALTGLFALHPMTLGYGANGMSEALFLFAVLLSTRYLVRWTIDRSTTALMMTGLGLAIAYLTRYEAVVVAAGAAAVVVIFTFLGVSSSRRERTLASIAEALVLLTPIWLAMLLWAAASWVITGNPFEILTSVYGNAAYVERAATENAAATGQGTSAAVGYVTRQLTGLAPLGIAIALVATVSSIVRRDPRIIAVAAPLGMTVAFQSIAFLNGSTYGWLRFYIAVVPLTTLLAGVILSRSSADDRPLAGPFKVPRLAYGLALAFALGSLLAAFPSSVATMADRSLGRGETAEMLNALLGRTGPVHYAQYSADLHLSAQSVALALDDLELPAGSVLLDAATGFPVIMQSRNPSQFVITPDRDFAETLARPAASRVRYILVPPDFRSHDAINRTYPELYERGAAWVELTREFRGVGLSPDWRLYRVISDPLETATGER
jgi:hypothetical protein